QVERIRSDKNRSREVRVPGILVDAMIIDPEQPQTYAVKYNPGYSGELKVPVPKPAAFRLDPRAIIARRASLELFPGCIANLGYGVSTGIADIVAREGVVEEVTLTVEQGIIGGIPVK